MQQDGGALMAQVPMQPWAAGVVLIGSGQPAQMSVWMWMHVKHHKKACKCSTVDDDGDAGEAMVVC